MNSVGGGGERGEQGDSAGPDLFTAHQGRRDSYPAVNVFSRQSVGAALIREETRTALLADLNIPRDLQAPICIDPSNPQMLHPATMAMRLYQGEFRYLSGLNEGEIDGKRMDGMAVAKSFSRWGTEAFLHPENPAPVNSAALGIGLVLRAFRLQSQWPFTERLAALHSGQVFSALREDDLKLLERHILLIRELYNTEVPMDQPHLRYCIDRLAVFCGDEFSLADGAGGAYRVVNKFWAQLAPPQ